MGKYIQSLSVCFDTEIANREIPLLRGAVLKTIGSDVDVLFHNHADNDKYRYSYPLIQYKRLHKKAAIVCIGEGTEKIGQFFSQNMETLMLGEREVHPEVEKIVPVRMLVQIWDTMFEYHLTRWIPLNAKNYQLYKTADGVLEQVALLENILKGNLLAMLKGFGIFLEQTLDVKITKINEPYLQYNKGIGMMAFDVDFKSNLSIPNNLGIGKNASIGFGVVRQMNRRNIEKDEK